jgi:glycosyltransferase involved in cell wall biosynthesis
MDDQFADHLIDGVSALVAQERDPHEWARLLAAALLPADGAPRVGEEAAARAAARFSSARCAEQLADACASIVRGPSIPFPGPAPA